MKKRKLDHHFTKISAFVSLLKQTGLQTATLQTFYE